MQTEQRFLSRSDHPLFWFTAGSFVGLAATTVGGFLAWGDRWPEDSGALVVPVFAALIGIGVSAVIFGYSLAYGHRGPVTSTIVVVVLLIMSQVFAWVQVEALMDSCGGTGPQPAFCETGAEPPSRYLIHAALGLILGLTCVVIGRGRVGTRRRPLRATP
jgi:hypothetical protein